MKNTTEKAIKALIKKAEEANSSVEALQFSQAAANVANALAAFNNTKAFSG